MFKEDIKKPLAELPTDADLSKPEWSWAFASNQNTGVILHTDDEGTTTGYVLPWAMCQLVVAVRERATIDVQCAVKRALGIPLVF